MDIAKLLQSVLNRLVRKAVDKGVDLDVNRAGKTDRPQGEAETAQAKAARDMVKKARKAASLTRKIGR